MTGSARREATAAKRLDPILVAERWGATEGEQDLRVPADLACWPGHFPELPVVPGVLQIGWVVQAAERWLGPGPVLERIEGLKFKSLLRPDQCFRLALEWDEARRTLRFRLFDGDMIFSTGRLVPAAPETP